MVASALAAGPPGDGWELVFHDEFNGKQLDWNVWACEKGDRRKAYNDPDDSYLDGRGHLVLRVRKAEDGKYHLGFIRTTREFDWGYYEARADLNTVPGYWSAFWLWGKQSYNADYSGAEVDIMEDPNRGGTIAHNIHQGGGQTRKHEGKPGSIKGPRTDWHLFACDWHEQGFDFFVDGEKTWTTRTMTASKPNWIYLTEEAMNEGWAGDIRQYESQLPAYWTVDYVRYYRRNPQAPSIALSSSRPIQAGKENGAVIRVALKNGTFAARLHPESWSVENLPAGVGLGTVERVDDTHLDVTLKGNSQPRAVKEDVADVTVIAEGGEVASSPALLIAVSGVTIEANAFNVFGREWRVRAAADWKVDQEDGSEVLRLLEGREPLPGPRRPFQFALTDLPDYRRVTVDADVKPLGLSLMIVFGYRDQAHFDYAHLSTDTGAAQPNHNGVFHVYGGERVRISNERGPASFAASARWYHVRLTHDAKTGGVAVTVDGKAVPALEAVDLSLGAGKVGIGSFDERAEFKNVRISATR